MKEHFDFDEVNFVTSDHHFGHARNSELASRPFDTGIPLLHAHTHEHDFGPHGSHEFHVGVDAFDFAPVQFELIDAWLEDLCREEEEIAVIL